MIIRDRHYIDGAWVAPAEPGKAIDVISPSTGQVIGSVPQGSSRDADRAVAAAVAAFPGWSATPVTQRVALLTAIADGLEQRRDEIIGCIIGEVGTPRAQAEIMQFNIVVHTFRDAAEQITALVEDEKLGNSVIRREPVGVVGAITPWNYPLYQAALKIAPALAAGCTVVLKPSEVAGLSPFLLLEVIDSVGVPPGVVNMVSGDGATVGEAIASHPDVDIVSFTGSDRAGRRVAELAAGNITQVALELGGKNPTVLAADADLDAAVPAAVASCFSNAGQTCAALTRLIVPASLKPEVERRVVEQARTFAAGDPFDRDTKLGPVISERQRERVLSLMRTGASEGARLLLGGPDADSGVGAGFYVAPTVFTDVAPTATIAQEEIFGPVMSIITVHSDEEAVAVANGTRYGLNAAVWSADVERANRIAAGINASTVYINGGKFNASAPFGGTKGSGYGRERGRYGVEEYLRVKSYQY